MKRFTSYHLFFGIAIIATLSLALLSLQSADTSAQQTIKTGVSENEETGIQWLSVEEALIKHKEEPRMWVVDVWTTWCGWCKRMDKTTFSDPILGKLVNEKYYAVSFDAEQKADVTIEGRTYKFVDSGRRGYHELAKELLGGSMSYPTVVFLNDQRQIMNRIKGFQTKEQFYPIAQFLNEYDPQNPITYDDFNKTYVSPYPEVAPEANPK